MMEEHQLISPPLSPESRRSEPKQAYHSQAKRMDLEIYFVAMMGSLMVVEIPQQSSQRQECHETRIYQPLQSHSSLTRERSAEAKMGSEQMSSYHSLMRAEKVCHSLHLWSEHPLTEQVAATKMEVLYSN